MNQPFRKVAEALPPLNIPEGNLCRRLLTVRTLASYRRANPLDVASRLWPNDRALTAVIVTRAASAPAMTSVAGWAQELAHKLVYDAVEALGAASAAAELMRSGLLVSWDGGYGTISVPAFVATANGASFVQEGQPIPVKQFGDTAVSLTPFKVASISVLTREMLESSNAERLIGDVLIRSAGLAMDAAFFDANPATAARPAGIRNGIATLVASTDTDSFGVFAADLSALVGAVGQVGGRGPFAIIGSAGKIASATVRFVSGNDDIPFYISGAVGNDLIAVAPQAIAGAVDPDPDVQTATAGSLVMDDTAPALPDTTQPQKGLFQSETIAIKVRWPVSWAVRDARGVAWLTPSWK